MCLRIFISIYLHLLLCVHGCHLFGRPGQDSRVELGASTRAGKDRVVVRLYHVELVSKIIAIITITIITFDFVFYSSVLDSCFTHWVVWLGQTGRRAGRQAGRSKDLATGTGVNLVVPFPPVSLFRRLLNT